MAKKPKNHNKTWTNADLKTLLQLARQITPTRVIGLKMDRTEAAIYGKAQDIGLSLKPTNQSPYNRRKS